MVSLRASKSPFKKGREAPKTKDEKEVEESYSEFAKRYKKSKAKARGKNNPTIHDMLIKKALLSAALKMVPMAEKNYYRHKSESAGYVWAALVNQAKDLSSEIRNFTDLEGQADHISREFVNQAFVLVTQQLLARTAAVKSTVDSSKNISTKDARAIKGSLDELVKELAVYMQVSSEGLHTRIKSYLTGEDITAAVGKGKKKRS